ncbi:MAG TPA: M56 family metallopeptidase [Gemmatimonadaceae bacterium]|nr:M56 family metallopeptidase [Gemmatimonadaceae bacterium]
MLALVPVALAAGISLTLRRANAQGRNLAWRSAVVVMLLIVAGRQLPLHWMAWVVPSALAAPLVALGRVQVTSVNAAIEAGESVAGTSIAAMILLAYAVGVVVVCASTLVGLWRAQRILRRARPADADWITAMNDARAMLGVRRRIVVLISRDVSVPLTWGFWHPVVLLPATLPKWSADERRLVMLHEAEHARSGDWLFALAARAACAVYWFHPAVWWTTNQLRADCELACDERVLAAGARRSDYADLLVRAVDALAMRTDDELPALALSRRGGLRARLSALIAAPREVRPLARRWAAAATAATLIASAPLSAVDLAPTRDVLTTLMRDARWESRAYAVQGLARRPDSIAVARSAAALDPSPRVREWARYALGLHAVVGGLSATSKNP